MVFLIAFNAKSGQSVCRSTIFHFNFSQKYNGIVGVCSIEGGLNDQKGGEGLIRRYISGLTNEWKILQNGRA